MPRLLTFDELRDHGVPYTRGHLHRLEQSGQFPKRVPIGASRVGWVEDEIDRFVEERIQARSTLAGTIGSARKRPGSKTPRP